jgi:hypothetical protein
VKLPSRVLLPAGAIEVNLTSLYLLTGSSFQERRRSVPPVGYLPEDFSKSEEYMLCILPVLAWEYIVEWMVHYCFMFKKRSRKMGGVMPIIYSEFY